MSLPHEPNIQDQERAEVMQNLAQDACEAWLRRRGMGTKSFRDQISDSAKTTVAEKNEKEDSH